MRFFNHQEHDFSRIERGVFDDGFVQTHRVSLSIWERAGERVRSLLTVGLPAAVVF